ncbi:MAG: hypothetical protein HZB41_06510 [Ignavibacteriae bacterium]|nr:hypothetical protein [Ignavibacteriota bacterium]
MEDESEFKIDPTGYDEMIRQAIAEVIAEKFMNGEMYLKVVDDYKKNGDDVSSVNDMEK